MYFNKTRFFKKRIRKNQKAFLQMEKQIRETVDLDTRCALAYEAATFAVVHTTDVFSSPVIENVFLEKAKSLSAELPEHYNEHTVLHVMTEAYAFGGHTRCVERWIQQMPEQKHSCVVLSQHAPFPPQLKTIVEESGGEMSVYEPDMKMDEKALKLRQYASKFEYIVLHIHMNDPIALIAFGTTEFKRPIIFFNHADHAFWLGVSISDHVADLNANRNTLTIEYRGARNASVLGIPMDNSMVLEINKEEARKTLNIPADKKVIFSAGQARKYHPLKTPCFYNIVSDLVLSAPNVVFYIAGVDEKEEFWPKLKKKHPDKVFLFGQLDYKTEFPLYLAIADLVIDSYPVGGETFVIDAIKAQKPVLTLNTLVQAAFLINSLGCCHSYRELIKKSKKILADKDYAQHVYGNIHEGWLEETNSEHWRAKCRKIFETLPKEHGLYSFSRPKTNYKITRFSLETTRWTEPYKPETIEQRMQCFRKNAKRLRRSLFTIHLKKNEQVIKLFGVYLLNRKEFR